MTTRPKAPARWWREPLVHFVAIGALLFLVSYWRGGGGLGSNRIVITPGQIDSIVAGFARTALRRVVRVLRPLDAPADDRLGRRTCGTSLERQ